MSLAPTSRGRPIAALAVAAVLVGTAAWLGEWGGDPQRLPAQLGESAPLCDPRFCGNGEPDPGEQCDDHNNTDGDGCDSLCRIECDEDIDCPSGECSGGVCTNLCGNGVVDPSRCGDGGCSQAEQCDDGAQNGRPGACTTRCTFCGNGVIDTVNGEAEQCDDGALNGEPGSDCSVQCTTDDPPECNGDGQCSATEACTCADCFGASRCSACDGDAQCEAGESCSCGDCSGEDSCQTHTTCVDEQCVSVPGQGTNDCTTDGQCANTQRLKCVNQACTVVQEPGMDLCDTNADCADDTHRQCNLLFQTCEVVDGAAQDQCETDGNCANTTLACVGEQCVPVPGTDLPSCQTDASCIPQCNGDGVCGADESCSCLDCFGASRCDACDGDAQCEAGESCSCGDCSGEDSCQTHAACVDDQCVSVAGAGTNDCDDNADCTRTERLKCVNQACTVVQEPGMDLCDADADCTDDTHRQCNLLFQTCEVVDGAAQDQCEDGGDCENFTLACVGEQCAIVSGTDLPSCAIGENCGGECGNGVVEAGENCDDGELNGVWQGNECRYMTCNADCSLPRCGDGTVNACTWTSTIHGGEECDDGDQNGQPGSNCSAQCTVPSSCNLDGQCSATESCQCLDCMGAARCDACDGDNLCEEGESCACNDCTDTPSCLAHTTCDPFARQCIVVLGPGTNDCTSDEQCENTERLKCVNQACAIVQEPGANLCDTSADCCDPADPACVHRQCNPFTQSCITMPGPSTEECVDDANCTDFHSACESGQCVLKEGAGPSECLDSSQCGSLLCGNGTLDEGEDCDDGEDNRTEPPEDLGEPYCKASSCTLSACNDEGDNDGDGLPDALDAGCWEYDLSSLGANDGGRSFFGWLLAQNDEMLDPIPPERLLPGKDDEACPAETVDRGSFCAIRCEDGDVCPGGGACPDDGVCPVLCPNGAIDTVLGVTEECDDGNLIDDDFCSNICRLNTCVGQDCPRCGNGVHEPAIGEQCDDGNDDESDACTNNCRIRCDDDGDCPGTCDLTTNQCDAPLCGDGEVNQAWERCDDGNIDEGDACNNQCQPVCHGDADCDSGKCDEERLVCVPLCGNGRYDSGEQCDDGNAVNNDGCTNACKLRCEDDATCDCDETKGICRDPCGNGRLDPGEQCDDGNTEDRDQCNNQCRIRCRPGTICPDNQACPQNGVCNPQPRCGDGVVSGIEQCDDGNAVDGDGCSNACVARCDGNAQCPNGLVCAGETCAECSSSLQCADGFCVDGRCRQALPLCGNGVVEPGESCDDGNADDGDSCTTRCAFPTGHACSSSGQCQTRLCQQGSCQPCSAAGQCGSGLRCSEGNCLFGPVTCGDGTVQAGEACDDANFDERDQCTSACLLAFGASCSHAADCQSAVCSGGACAPCRADAECAAGRRCAIGLCLTDAQMALYPNLCGNGFVEGDEACDDGNALYGDGCTPTCDIGNDPVRREVAANVAVQLPFTPVGGPVGTTPTDLQGNILHAGGGGLSDTGPATVAVMAAGAAAGTAWVRRRWKSKRR